MALLLSIYGKGGSGKSTITSNLSACFAMKGMNVLQIGCDPKHDSTFSINHKFIPTVIEVLLQHNFHYEDIKLEEIVHVGYKGIHGVEAGGPPAGTGCAGYVIGETIRLLEHLNAFDNYDVVLFDVLGDIVCGGFSVPLQYSQYVCVVAMDDFDSLFAANRIVAGVIEKAKMYPIKLAGIIGNRSLDSIRLHKFAGDIGTKIISVINDSKEIKKARLMGKTLVEISENDCAMLSFIKPYEDIADYFLKNELIEAGTTRILSDREMFEKYMEKES